MQYLVLGASGIVGGYIVSHLARTGFGPFALSRSKQNDTSRIRWFLGDLAAPDTINIPPVDIVISTAHPSLVVGLLNLTALQSVTRIVFFTSSSIDTKLNTGAADERKNLQMLADGERRLIAECERLGISWTVLRPTVIYAEGRDVNVTRIARLIERLGVVLLAGSGAGLRQPVHAEDLALGAIAAATTQLTANKRYFLPGKETLTYREMVGRVFDGLGKPRRIISIPTVLWKMAFTVARPLFPNANAAMGERMSKNMVFDILPAQQDFGWDPRAFRPKFRIDR